MARLQAATLPELFTARVAATPDAIAYQQFDSDHNQWISVTWRQMQGLVSQYRRALKQESLLKGDKIAIWLRNCIQWVCMDQAALSLGLVVVPLYTDDRAENCAYILTDAEVKLLFLGTAEQWTTLETSIDQTQGLKRILTLTSIATKDTRLCALTDWISEAALAYENVTLRPEDLATIVYTSGTTGRPKGVMLTHGNIVWNANASMEQCPAYETDLFLSFLPLSHTFERTVGYYASMLAGASVAYSRSIPQLAEDLQTLHPTVMISVPRIFERVYAKIQAQLETKSPFAKKLFLLAIQIGWQRFLYQQHHASWSPQFLLWPLLDVLVAKKVLAKLGGRLRLTISGGAALNPSIAQFFIGLGVPLIQGYGLTESSPVLTANKMDNNIPASVGMALPGVTLKINAQGELLARSPGITQGYWHNPAASAQLVDAEGWLHTGDKARIEDEHVFITGRIKEIIVLANGEKVPPGDMESAIALDPLFEQVMLVGEGKPYLAAVITLDPKEWEKFCGGFHKDPADPHSCRDAAILKAIISRVGKQLHAFPGYAQVRQVAIQTEPWTVENRLITPTMKLKRTQIAERFANEIEQLYLGH